MRTKHPLRTARRIRFRRGIGNRSRKLCEQDQKEEEEEAEKEEEEEEKEKERKKQKNEELEEDHLRRQK